MARLDFGTQKWTVFFQKNSHFSPDSQEDEPMVGKKRAALAEAGYQKAWEWQCPQGSEPERAGSTELRADG